MPIRIIKGYNKKMASIVFNWRHLAVMTLTAQFTNHFMSDLKEISLFSGEF